MEVAHGTQKRPILYVITKGTWGGAQRYVYDMATAAQQSGHPVVVVYGEPGELARRLEGAGVRTVQVPSLVRDVALFGDVGALVALTRLMKAERPFVVHLNSSKAGAVGALAARLARVPRIIFTAHGWAFNEARPWWQRCIFGLVHAITILLSHTTLCVSEAVRRDMNWLPFAGRKLNVVRLGIACPDFVPALEARAHLLPTHTEGFWVGMISELHPTKRIEDAIEGFAGFRTTLPTAHLVVLGEGEERPKLERLIQERGLEGSVHLIGFVENAQRYLSVFDLFLHTSRSEALGYAVLEAGCAGLPVIATNVGGIPEVVTDGEHGLLISRGAPNQVREALTSLAQDEARRRSFGAALKERVQSRFSLDRMVSETLAVYD